MGHTMSNTCNEMLRSMMELESTGNGTSREKYDFRTTTGFPRTSNIKTFCGGDAMATRTINKWPFTSECVSNAGYLSFIRVNAIHVALYQTIHLQNTLERYK